MNKLNSVAGQLESAAPSINDRNGFPLRTMNKLQDDILQSAGSINEDAKNSLNQPVRSITTAACKMNMLLVLKELWLFSFQSAAR